MYVYIINTLVQDKCMIINKHTLKFLLIGLHDLMSLGTTALESKASS